MRHESIAIIFRCDGGAQEVTGQVARTLAALVEAGSRGVTALEMSSWALRLAHYVLCLRKLGVPIQMVRELHPGGWHGRYTLLVDVQILSVETSEAAA
jgi:hypothetical protein